jgi:CHAD domain-containing protein
VRIKLKRARYAAELAQPVAGKPARRFIERAKDLQDLLGDHQDAVTAQARLKTLADSLGDPAVSLVAGRLLERQVARRSRLLERFPKKWRKLDKRGRKLWG